MIDKMKSVRVKGSGERVVRPISWVAKKAQRCPLVYVRASPLLRLPSAVAALMAAPAPDPLHQCTWGPLVTLALPERHRNSWRFPLAIPRGQQ